MRKKLLSFIADLEFTTHWRGNCPICGGDNTFSVSRINGEIIYHCFKASCHVSGTTQTRMSYDEILAGLALCLDGGGESAAVVWNIPDHFTYPNDACLDYLVKNNCIEALDKRLIDIRYDPKQHRCVFLIKHEGECYGAVGRALNSTTSPKWYVYGNEASRPFVVAGSSTYAVLVEDAASACSVSRVADGIALLGTNISDTCCALVSKYSNVFVSLDKDASAKAIDLQRHLSFYTHAEVVLLERDLKYFNRKEIEEWSSHHLK